MGKVHVGPCGTSGGIVSDGLGRRTPTAVASFLCSPGALCNALEAVVVEAHQGAASTGRDLALSAAALYWPRAPGQGKTQDFLDGQA